MRAPIICIIGMGLWSHAGAEPLLEGRVRLPSGAPVPGAQVLIFDLADLRAAPVTATTDGSGGFTLPLASLAGVLPERFELGANYPNPFNPSTMIPYQLPAPMYVRLQVFNLLGQRVATLVDGEQPAGFHTASWDATDAAGQAVGAGVYLYRLSGAGVQLSRSMLLMDGQGGIPSGGSGSTGSRDEARAESAPVYGLTVSGAGLVPYVDPAFRVEAGMAPLDLVVEAQGRVPPAKAASTGGILGDVDNTGGVDFFDALLVALYSRDSSIVMPNNGDISLGDVDADGQVDLTDAWLIAVWLQDPSDPSLPAGIGEPVGPAASLSPDPTTVTFADDGAWHRFTVEAGEPVSVVVNPEGTTPRLEIATRSGRSNFCPPEADDDVSRQDGQTLYLAGCSTGPATVELRRPSDGTVLRTYTLEVTGSPPDLVVQSVSVSDSTLTPGQAFTLRATVRNQGTGRSAATTLRYYRSSNRTISTRDTEAGTDAVGALAPSGTSAESIRLSAPPGAGTYYYGACVAPVAGESDTRNNCSPGVRVTVARASSALAPADQDAFDRRMVGESLRSQTFRLNLESAGRFYEYEPFLDGVVKRPGTYTYTNTGPDTGLLTLAYDGGRYRGGCSLRLTFASPTTGTLSYLCDTGLEGQEAWRAAEIGAPLPPQVVPRSGTDTALEVTFRRFFNALQTKAFDIQIRTKSPRGPWDSICGTVRSRVRTTASVTLGIVDLEPGTTYEIRFRDRNSSRCGEGSPGKWSEIGEGATTGTSRLRFPEGESVSRSIPENTPAGINVGPPVLAAGGAAPSTLTYTISGPDAWSFDMVPETGQIRTREGVTYDYESEKRYAVTVRVEDDGGSSATIDVTINIVDLVPFGVLPSNLNLRTNHSDQRQTLRWDPLPDMQGHARVLGYQTEIRRGRSGAWTDRRTFLGRNISGMIYANLVNEIGYQVRVRAITAEGESEWSTPVWGIPTADLAPKDPDDNFDRFGTKPVGSPDRNFRFLTPGRCRHTSGGQTLDADCQYRNTGPDTGTITLEFDDPSRGSCSIGMLYSAPNAGNLNDDCFSAGVRVPFDTSFRMPSLALPPGPRPPEVEPPLAPRNQFDTSFRLPALALPAAPRTPEVAPPLAPRNQEEFDALVSGRDDFIPGLVFNRFCVYCDRTFISGSTSRIEFSDGLLSEIPGEYSYRNIGPSEGVLTFEGNDGNTYVFNLDFEPSSNVRVTTTDPSGNTTVWPGMLYLDATLGAPPPILLPLPPYWSEAIGIETDFAPEDWVEWDRDGFSGYERALFGNFYEMLFGDGDIEGLSLLNSQTYEKLGRNRAVLTVNFGFTGIGDQSSEYENLDEFQREMFGSTWTFDLTFTSDGAAKLTLTITKDGHLPTVVEAFVDFAGDSANLDGFPEELLLPDDPPQASGEDVSGVEVASAVTIRSIGPDDVQTFLVSNTGAAYQPGDWLEPKDGSNQRMMIVGVGAGKRVASFDPASSPLHQRDQKVQSTIAPHSSPVFAAALAVRAKRASQPAYSNSSITQLSVVCMQRLAEDIPKRGDRYFSQPKTAQDAVQLCQQNCVLNEPDYIQSCVWECEADAQENQ